MKKGILYGVGVGPGDPELLTIKAHRILSQADVIAVPDKGAGEKTAMQIVGELIEGKTILPCSTPMVRDPAALERAHDRIAADIAALLEEGKTVAYITLGDPSIYSTYLYIHRRALAMGYEARLIPGVPSFCAVAAALGTGLCEGSDRLLIVPASGGRGHGGELRHGGGAGVSPVCRRAGGQRVLLRGGGEAGWAIAGSPCSLISPAGGPWWWAAGQWACAGRRCCAGSARR